jgi:pheromone shutdown-related protein TraB
MLRFRNLSIIGTSHIAERSLEEIEKAFVSFNPDIVAVELDHGRLEALISNKKPDYSPRLIREIGFKGYLFALIGGIVQAKLGDIVGVKPGSDMLRAVILARDNGRRVALIDQDIRITLSRLSQKISWKERFNFIIDIFKAPFSKRIKINLKDVPEKNLINQLLLQLRRRYPNLYSVLVEDRNKHMAFRLKSIMSAHEEQKILAVVGAGHEEEILTQIKSLFLHDQKDDAASR